jgi:hypothetical protein
MAVCLTFWVKTSEHPGRTPRAKRGLTCPHTIHHDLESSLEAVLRLHGPVEVATDTLCPWSKRRKTKTGAGRGWGMEDGERGGGGEGENGVREGGGGQGISTKLTNHMARSTNHTMSHTDGNGLAPIAPQPPPIWDTYPHPFPHPTHTTVQPHQGQQQLWAGANHA